MYQKAKINVGGIPDLVNSYGGALKLVPGEVPVFHYVERKSQKALLSKICCLKQRRY